MTAKERKQIASIFRRAAEISDELISMNGVGFCCMAIVEAKGSLSNRRFITPIFSELFFSEDWYSLGQWWGYEDRHARPIALLLAAEIIESGDWE